MSRRRRTSLAIRAWQLAGVAFVCLPLLGCAAYGFGWLLLTAGRVVAR